MAAPQYETIDNRNLTGGVFENLWEALHTIDDPLSGYKRKFIYARDPHVKAQEFDGYPILILQDYFQTDVSKTVNDGHNITEGGFQIDVWGDEDDPSSFDQLSDAVMTTLLTSEQEDIGEHGMPNVTMERNNRTTGIDEKEDFILVREMEFGFRSRIDMKPG